MTSLQRSDIRAVVEQVLGDLEAVPAAPPVAAAPVVPAPVVPAPAARSGAPAPIAQARGGLRRVAIGADHGGFRLKESLMELLDELRWEVLDVGTHSTEPCDYPDLAVKVGRAVQEGRCRLGIMIDGAGIGSAMALNKLAGIRAATVHSEATARNSREHNDANVLVLGAGQIHPGHARRITRIWLATEHAGGRHAKRVEKINALDQGRAPLPAAAGGAAASGASAAAAGAAGGTAAGAAAGAIAGRAAARS